MLRLCTHLEESHHRQTAGNCGDTVEQEHLKTSCLHLCWNVAKAGVGTGAGDDGGGGVLGEATHRRDGVLEVEEAADSTTLEILHNLIPDNCHSTRMT